VPTQRVVLRIMNEAVFRRVSKLAVLMGPAVTLTVTPLWNYDPINPGKVLVLSLLAFFGFGYLVPNIGQIITSTGKAIWIVCLLFLLSLLSSFIFSGAPSAQQFWGVFGRNTGVLTYVSLIFALLIVVSIQNSVSYRRIVNWLVLVGVLETGYASLQLLGLDPIEWSFSSAFGTLGNVNFLSGFLGISCAALSAACLSSEVDWKLRIVALIFVFYSAFIAYSTDSIQGPIAFAGGVGALLLMKATTRGWKYLIPTLMVSLVTLTLLTFALFNKGPLASLVYQVTINFRGDYMHAGIKMMMDKPLFGVGIDSYDDWYRYQRGTISAFRTAFNRTSNTAHNVALDLGAGGGVPLFLSYICLMGLVLITICKAYKKGYFADLTFTAAVSAWVAYQIQASVSINQIGVGVWGWILSGIILGYFRMPTKEKEGAASDRAHRTKTETKAKLRVEIPASSALAGGILACLGLALSFLPAQSDHLSRRAINKGELSKVLERANSPITSSFFLSQFASATLNSQLNDPARTISEIFIDRYPRNYYAWTMRLSSPPFSDAERMEARERLRGIDPHAALCLAPAMPGAMLDLLKKLPLDQQEELLRGWGIEDNMSMKGFAGLIQPSVDLVDSKLRANCI